MLEGLSERWERMAVRERRLVGLLGVVAVLCALAFLGLLIKKGLGKIAERNAEVREALDQIAARKDDVASAKSKDEEITAMIGDEATPLGTYLEGIASESGVKIHDTADQPPEVRGKFHRKAVTVNLYGVSLPELVDFLTRVETTSPIVATESLHLRRSSADKGKFDHVEITVETFERGKAQKPEANGQDAGTTKAAEANP